MVGHCAGLGQVLDTTTIAPVLTELTIQPRRQWGLFIHGKDVTKILYIQTMLLLMDSTSPSNRPALHKLRKGCANRTGKVSHNRYHTCGKQERGSNNCPSQKAGTQPKKTREQSSKNSHIIATQESRTSDCLGGNFGRPKTC